MTQNYLKSQNIRNRVLSNCYMREHIIYECYTAKLKFYYIYFLVLSFSFVGIVPTYLQVSRILL